MLLWCPIASRIRRRTIEIADLMQHCYPAFRWYGFRPGSRLDCRSIVLHVKKPKWADNTRFKPKWADNTRFKHKWADNSGLIDSFDIFDITSILTDTKLNLAETLVYCFLCYMPPNILRNILRYYRCYHIIHSNIRGCEIVLLIDFFICCVLIKVQPASFHQRKDNSKQRKSSETNPLKVGKKNKVAKIVISLSHLPPPPSIKLIRLFFGVNINLCRYSASPCRVHGTYAFN